MMENFYVLMCRDIVLVVTTNQNRTMICLDLCPNLCINIGELSGGVMSTLLWSGCHLAKLRLSALFLFFFSLFGWGPMKAYSLAITVNSYLCELTVNYLVKCIFHCNYIWRL